MYLILIIFNYRLDKGAQTYSKTLNQNNHIKLVILNNFSTTRVTIINHQTYIPSMKFKTIENIVFIPADTLPI